jgi:hypothetical protein
MNNLLKWSHKDITTPRNVGALKIWSHRWNYAPRKVCPASHRSINLRKTSRICRSGVLPNWGYNYKSSMMHTTLWWEWDCNTAFESFLQIELIKCPNTEKCIYPHDIRKKQCGENSARCMYMSGMRSHHHHAVLDPWSYRYWNRLD